MSVPIKGCGNGCELYTPQSVETTFLPAAWETGLEVFTTSGALVNEGSERLQKHKIKKLSVGPTTTAEHHHGGVPL